jgi:hypothetical protein
LDCAGGAQVQVIALDGNAVAQPQTVEMLSGWRRRSACERGGGDELAGAWVLGEVRKHVQAAGMGIVVEYAGATGKPVWTQPEDLVWNYRQFAERRR